MAIRTCGHCRTQQAIEWIADYRFGAGAEAARCPLCGAVWGVRTRRKSLLDTPALWAQARAAHAAPAVVTR